MTRRERNKALRSAKYLTDQLRPTIYRIPQNVMPCKKECDCKRCKAYWKAIGELNTNENNPHCIVFNSNQNPGATSGTSRTNVPVGGDSSPYVIRSGEQNSVRQVEVVAG